MKSSHCLVLAAAVLAAGFFCGTAQAGRLRDAAKERREARRGSCESCTHTEKSSYSSSTTTAGCPSCQPARVGTLISVPFSGQFAPAQFGPCPDGKCPPPARR